MFLSNLDEWTKPVYVPSPGAHHVTDRSRPRLCCQQASQGGRQEGPQRGPARAQGCGPHHLVPAHSPPPPAQRVV